MKRQKVQVTLIVWFSIVVLFVVIYSDKYTIKPQERLTLQVNQYDIDILPGVRFFFPSDENSGLDSDVYSTIFEENELNHYLIVTKDFRPSEMVCYAIDQNGNYLRRYVISHSDTGNYNIGNRSLNIVYTELPILSIMIDSLSPSFDELLASDKTVECYGEMCLYVDKKLADENHWINKVYSRDKKKNTEGSLILKGRGNNSWSASPKKSFTVELEEPVFLLGMGRYKSFNLVSNSQDKSLLNNEIFLGMSDRLGIEFEPEYEQVTLYVNGEYQGVYLLTSKVKVGGGSVRIGQGDFLINWGDPNPEQKLLYDTEMWIDDEKTTRPYANIVWPKYETEEELAQKRVIIQRFISCIEDEKSDEYKNCTDIESMIRYYWIQEISMNYDADYRSAYTFYKADTDKLYMGPVWDMDLALGWNAYKDGKSFTDPTGWKIRGLSWYKYLFERTDFRNEVYEAYWNGGVRDAMFGSLEEFEKRADIMCIDGQLNYRRWRADVPDLSLIYGNNYEEEVKGRIEFFRQRIEWIDSNMME